MGVMVFKVLDLRSSEKLDQKHVFFMILIQYAISKIFVAFSPMYLEDTALFKEGFASKNSA